MDQQNPDQSWQQLQNQIEGFFRRMLINDVPSIEYKPRFIALLEMSSEHQRSDLPETGM